jgi:hypothetical protein
MTVRPYIGNIGISALLGVQSDELLGPAREPTDDDDWIGFSVDSIPGGNVTVTLWDACDLTMVFSSCREIGDAILDQGDDRITFTRDDGKAVGRLAEFRAMKAGLPKPRGRCRVDLDLTNHIDPTLARKQVIKAQSGLGMRITVYDLLRAHTDALLGPAPRSDDDTADYRVTYLPNGELMVTLVDNCDLVGVLTASRLITQELLSPDTGWVSFTRFQPKSRPGNEES